jgi:hypothetical protein
MGTTCNDCATYCIDHPLLRGWQLTKPYGPTEISAVTVGKCAKVNHDQLADP